MTDRHPCLRSVHSHYGPNGELMKHTVRTDRMLHFTDQLPSVTLITVSYPHYPQLPSPSLPSVTLITLITLSYSR